MLKNIKIKFDLIEMMQFYWESKKNREKLPDSFFIEIAQNPDMEILYDDDFDAESVRRVLSAVMNNELVNHPTKKESRFWNYNMWMIEDLDVMRAMMQPMKQLNLDELYDEFKEDSKYSELEVVFVPGHLDKEYIDGNTYYFNFFNLTPNVEDPSHIQINGQEVKDYFLDAGREILG